MSRRPRTTGVQESRLLASRSKMISSGRAILDGDELGGHHPVELGEAIEPGGIVLGEDADGLLVRVDDDDDVVGALVDEVERLLDRIGGPRA